MTAPAPSLDAIIAAAAETGATITVPGLLNWLGRDAQSADSDFRQSINGGFTETLDEFCQRISKAAS